MNYMSPIDVITTQARMAYEDGILKAVHDVGFIVEKEELEKALAFDRNQYAEGFSDGKKETIDHFLKIINDHEERLSSFLEGTYIQAQKAILLRIRDDILEWKGK